MTYSKSRFRQVEAKKTVRNIKLRHMQDMAMEAVHAPDKDDLRAQADQAMAEWQNRAPRQRTSNLSDYLNRKY